VLHYSDPAGQFILSDGATLSMYVPENAQVVRGRITRAGEDLNFFRLILGYLRTSDAEVDREIPGTFFRVQVPDGVEFVDP